MFPALDVLCAGEALWDLKAPPGASFEEARSLGLLPGGSAVNTAIHLVRMGLRAGIAATVGDDALGRALCRRVADEGVDVSLVIESRARTGLVFQSSAEGAQQFVSYRDPEAPPAPIPADASAKVLLLTGLLPSAEQVKLFTEAALRARQAGSTVVIDVNARHRLWSSVHGALDVIAPVLAAADVVKASADDLRALGLEEAIPQLRAALGAGAVLVLTAGPDPARAIGPFGEIASAPEPRSGFDPTGAGDAFTAGMIAALLEAGTWDRALARGHASARAFLSDRW